MPLNAKDARIFIKFNEDGTRDDTRIEGANLEIIPPQAITKMVDGEEVVTGQTEEIIAAAVYDDGSYDEFDLTGYIETSYEDYMLYCGNSPDGKEYVRNMETGEPMEKPPYVPTLEEAKKTKIAELKAERDQKEVLPIEYNGNSFDYDDKARDRINAAIIALDMAGAEVTLQWTTADNTNTTVTAQDLRNIIAAVAMRSNTLHEQYRVAKEAVNAAETKEEVEAVTLEGNADV